MKTRWENPWTNRSPAETFSAKKVDTDDPDALGSSSEAFMRSIDDRLIQATERPQVVDEARYASGQGRPAEGSSVK